MNYLYDSQYSLNGWWGESLTPEAWFDDGLTSGGGGGSNWSLDAISTVDDTSYGASSVTLSHTVASGADLLTVSIALWKDVGPVDVLSVTYDGVALSQAGPDAGAFNMLSYVYYLVNPNPGTHNVVINMEPTGDSISHKIGVASFFATGGTPVIDDDAQATGSSSPITGALTASVADTLSVDSVSNFSANPLTIDAAQTTIQNDLSLGVTGASSYKINPSSGTVT